MLEILLIVIIAGAIVVWGAVVRAGENAASKGIANLFAQQEIKDGENLVETDFYIHSDIVPAKYIKEQIFERLPVKDTLKLPPAPGFIKMQVPESLRLEYGSALGGTSWQLDLYVLTENHLKLTVADATMANDMVAFQDQLRASRDAILQGIADINPTVEMGTERHHVQWEEQ